MYILDDLIKYYYYVDIVTITLYITYTTPSAYQ